MEKATKLPAGSGLAAARAGIDDASHAADEAIKKETAEPGWNLGEWLRSLNYEEAVQEHLEKAAKDAGLSPFELVRGYADDGKEPELFF